MKHAVILVALCMAALSTFAQSTQKVPRTSGSSDSVVNTTPRYFQTKITNFKTATFQVNTTKASGYVKGIVYVQTYLDIDTPHRWATVPGTDSAELSNGDNTIFLEVPGTGPYTDFRIVYQGQDSTQTSVVETFYRKVVK